MPDDIDREELDLASEIVVNSALKDILGRGRSPAPGSTVLRGGLKQGVAEAAEDTGQEVTAKAARRRTEVSATPETKGFLVPRTSKKGGGGETTVPEVLAGPFKAYEKMYDLLEKGAEPSDPEVVEAAAEVAGTVMGGSVFAKAPKGALRTGPAREGRLELLPSANKLDQERALSESVKQPGKGKNDNFDINDRPNYVYADDEFAPAGSPERIRWEKVQKQKEAGSEGDGTITLFADQDKAGAPIAAINELARKQRDVSSSGFYSHLEEQVQALPQNKGNPAEMFAAIENKGLKEAEVRATDLDVFMLGEQTAGVRRSLVDAKQALSRAKQELDIAKKDPKGEGTFKDQSVATWTEIVDEGTKAVAHGENLYKQHIQANKSPAKTKQEITDYIEAHRTPIEESYVRYDPKTVGTGQEPAFAKVHASKNDPTYREVELSLPLAKKKAPREPGANEDMVAEVMRVLEDELDDAAANFTGSQHFKENTVVWYNAALIKNEAGKDTLALGNIQSDWGQAGHGQGFRDPKAMKEYDAQAKALEKELGIGGDIGPGPAAGNMVRSKGDRDAALKYVDTRIAHFKKYPDHPDIEYYQDIKKIIEKSPAAKWKEYEEVIGAFGKEEQAVPHHPAVGSTDTWMKIGLRRAIKDAVDSGADSISIPTADTVVSYTTGANKKKMVEIYDKIAVKNMREIFKNDFKEPTPGNRMSSVVAQQYKYDTSGRISNPTYIEFPITDKVRESVKKGQRLYVGGVPLPDDEQDPGLAPEGGGGASPALDELLGLIETGKGSPPAPGPTATSPVPGAPAPSAMQGLPKTPEELATMGMPAAMEAAKGVQAEGIGTVVDSLSRATDPKEMRNILRGSGAAVGGMAGTPFGPPGVMVGTGAGSAVGSYLANVYDTVHSAVKGTDYERPEIMKSYLQPLQDAMVDASITGGVQVATPFVIGGGKALLARLLRLPPNSKELLKEASDIGVDIGVANVADSGIGRGAVNVMGRVPLIGGSAQNAAIVQARQLVAAQNDLFGQIAKPRVASEVSQEAFDEGSRRFGEFATRIQQRFEAASRAGEEAGAIIPTGAIKTKAAEVLAKFDAMPGTSRALLPNDTRKYLDSLTKLGDHVTTNDIKTIDYFLETSIRRAASGRGIYYPEVTDVKNTVLGALRRSDAPAAKLMAGVDNEFREGMRTFGTETAKTVGKVERNVFSTGQVLPGTKNADEMLEVVNGLTTPSKVQDARRVMGDDILRQSARVKLDQAWANAATDAPGAPFKFSADKFNKALGLDDVNSNKAETLKELLRGTGVDFEDVARLSRVAESVANAPIADVSTFMARAAVLRGAGGLTDALKGALTFGLASGVGGKAGGGHGIITSLAGVALARHGIGELMKPGLLRALVVAADPNTEKQAAISAMYHLFENRPQLFEDAP